MIITYLGHEFFKVQFGDLTLAFNPPSKESQLKSNKFGADIVLETIAHEDMSGGSELVYGDRAPFIVSGPGEYETKGIFIKGIAGASRYDLEGKDENLINTIYSLTVDNISMLFLGAQSTELPAQLSSVIDEVDVVFIPIGDEGVFSPKEAYKIAMNLDAKVIIPMHFSSTKDDMLIQFKKEAGGECQIVDKLTIKKKDIESKEGEVIILEPQG
jgi:L-ascorbate metabolism protein UlaG (beta-lactamase superfamily)